LNQTTFPNIKLFLPIYVWFFFSLFTLFIFEFGPLRYDVDNKFILYLYLFFAHLAIFLGYLTGVRKLRILSLQKFNTYLINPRMLRFITLIVFSSVLLEFYRDTLGDANLDLALEDPMEGAEAFSSARGGGLLGYMEAFLSVFTIPFFVIAIVNFKKINKFTKFVFLLSAFRILYAAVLGSNRHGIMMLLIVIFFGTLAAIFSEELKISLRRFILISLVSVMSFLAFSSYISIFRQTNAVTDIVEFMAQSDNYDFNYESFLNPTFSGNLEILNAGIYTGYFYFTHSYENLADALGLSFKGTTFLFGHSDFAIRNLERVFGSEVLDYSYHYRLINEGLHVSRHWITAYAWIASDTTFIGSIFLLFFFASLFAQSWIRSISMPSIASLALLAWMSYFFFQINITFVPADLSHFLGFWGTILVFKFTLNRNQVVGKA
tara:strand:- start:2510 stop:3811 length:1302 start_codon:yes stop_codon:yes gene_type:complete